MNRRLTLENLSLEGCLNMLEWFVGEIGRNYIKCFEAYLRSPNDVNIRAQYNSAKEFILSDYFAELTNMDGTVVVDGLERTYRRMLKDAA